MRRRLQRAAALCLAFGLLSSVMPLDVDARPGGGQGYRAPAGSPGGHRTTGGSAHSGGSRSKSSDSGSSWFGSSDSKSPPSEPWKGAPPSYSWPSITTDKPATGGSGYARGSGGLSSFFFLFVLGSAGLVGLVWGANLLRGRNEKPWESSIIEDDREATDTLAAEQSVPRYASVQDAIRGLRGTDEDFSWALFEDFLYALYTETHTLRGKGKLALLSPYMVERARQTLAAYPAEEVNAIVVGAMRVEEVRAVEDSRRVRVRVRFESNYTEVAEEVTAYWAEEVWVLSRSADTRSRPPERARVVDCPNCGAALDRQVAHACSHCGKPAEPGDHDWQVDSIEIVRREERGPMLTGTTEEQGTDLPTVIAPDAEAKYKELVAADPSFSWTAFIARVETTFHAFHAAWSMQDLAGVRPYLSDSLFETQRYWVQTYRAQRLHNVTQSQKVVTVHLSKVVRDKHFDAVTVRVYATCVDFTLDGDGKVVGGDRDKEREYSEYWTFLRRSGKTGAPRADGECPSCGAPIAEINMAGECQKCSVKVTSGEFDWVLSRMEQDDSYAV